MSSLSDFTDAQLYELNQNLLDDATDKNRPLIDKLSPLSDLREEYENGSQSFVKQIDYLKSKGFTSLRRTRGDGDCFYRSVAFAYVERLWRSDPRNNVLDRKLPLLEAAGFQKLVYEDFYDVLISLIENQDRGEIVLVDAFQSAEVSNSIVVFLRLLTSAQIRSDPEEYSPVLFHPEIGEQMAVRDFCESFVEAVGKEADHVQMSALCRALEIDVDVAYLDGRGDEVSFVEIRYGKGRAGGKPLVLLYRPGHYDILQ